jgi:polyhydroxyalkanoate synthesis regulator protein
MTTKIINGKERFIVEGQQKLEDLPKEVLIQTILDLRELAAKRKEQINNLNKKIIFYKRAIQRNIPVPKEYE